MVHPSVTRAADWAGIPLTDEQHALLRSYATWLVEEAIPAGGLGPREAERIWDRHIADSLTFGVGWGSRGPAELLDVGSGVGLPGIPLAIAWPDTYVTLLDRGGRRVRLLRRIVRILALPRVRVAQGDVFSVADEWEAIVFRGAVKAAETVGLASRLLAAPGRTVVGLSRRPEPPPRSQDLVTLAEALGLQAEIRQIPQGVLDGPAWLLIMARDDLPVGN